MKYSNAFLNPKKILVYRLGSLGDTIMALPSFRLIREKFPSSHITLLTNMPVSSVAAPVESVLGHSGLYDDVVYYEIHERRIDEILHLRKEIAKQKFDILFFLTGSRGLVNSLRDFMFFKSARVGKIIGTPFAKRDLHPIREEEGNLWEWEAVRLARRVRALGKIDLSERKYWELGFDEQEMKEAEDLAEKFGLTPRFLSFSIGAKDPVKDWGDENWGQLMSRLYLRYPQSTLVAVGAQDEKERTEKILSNWKGKKANLCGLCSPRLSGIILKSSKVFVGHDSGPTHLAGVVGTPVVALYSARNLPGQWYPYGNNNHIIYKKTFCFGCNLITCEDRQSWCIKSITVEEVLNAIRFYYEI